MESTTGTADAPGQGLGSGTKGGRVHIEPISKTTTTAGIVTSSKMTYHNHMDDQLGLGLRHGGSGSGGGSGGSGDRRWVEADWSKGLPLSIPSMLLHSSDTQVKPIVGNKAIEIIERATFKSPALPFPVVNGLDDIGKLSQAELEAHLTLIYKALHRHVVLPSPPTATNAASPATMTALNDRLNVLGYLSTIVHSAEVANIVLNTHFLSLLLRLLRGPPSNSTTGNSLSTTSSGSTIPYNSNNTPSATLSSTHNNNQHASATIYWNSLTACRTLAATILACSLRYTTFVQPPTTKTKEDHIIPTLINLLNPAYATNAGNLSGTGTGTGANSTAPSSSALKTGM